MGQGEVGGVFYSAVHTCWLGEWSVCPCYVICHSAFGAGVCALVSVLGVFCEIIFIRSHVLVLVFTSCVGGGGGEYVLWRNFGCGCKGHLLFPGKRTDFAFLVKLILLAAARVFGRLHTL